MSALIATGLTVILALAGADEGDIKLELSAEQVPRFTKLEMTLNAQSAGRNPYDPAEVDFQIAIKSPSGRRLSVPAFSYQDFERRPLSRGGASREWLYPVGQSEWKARFAPTEVGTYTCTAVLKDAAGTVQSAAFRFECTASKKEGYIRVSSRDRRYLEFEDGTPFFIVGQNVAFVHNGYRVIEKIRKLGEHGANFARVWACAEDWAMAIEARKSAWGRSWDWVPPIVATPGRDGYHSSKLCVKISGEAGVRARVSPAHPVGLRPATGYVLAGRMRADDGVGVALTLGGDQVIAGKPQWEPFKQEFTSGPDQWWLGDVDLRLTAKGTAWISDLSLRQIGGGPELLGEADVNRPVLGFYNQADCFLLDQVVEAAEQAGVYLQLILLTRNLYMPMLTKAGSAEYAEAVRYGQRLVRYCAARWGYSTHVAVWEYFNEMDPGLPTDHFYEELGRAFEAVDINRHLRANSTWSSPSKDYRHPQLDTADMHYYLRPANGEIWKNEVASILARRDILRQNVTNKPALLSEFGMTDNQWQHAPELDQDTEYIHLHNALWASVMSGLAGTVCHWFWDDIHQRDLYRHYLPIRRFVADVPWTTGQLRDTSATCNGGVQVVGLQGEPGAYLWLHDKRATWWNIAIEKHKPERINGALLSIDGLTSDTYRVEWWDTSEGHVTRRESARPTGNQVELNVPTFAGDIACKIVRDGGQ